MVSIVFPDSAEACVRERLDRPGFEYKAGGTDVVDRLRHHAAAPRGLVHLRRVAGLDVVRPSSRGITLGAGVTLATLADHPAVQERLPLLARAAEATATPQIRAMATLGGALAQRPRCPYFRDELHACAKKGGERCLARYGDPTDHAIFDNASCMAPHPSTIGAALLALEAQLTVRVAGGEPEPWPVQRFFTVPAPDPRPDHGLPEGALIEAIDVAFPPGETRQHYLRASPRHVADWAQVEVCAVLTLAGSRITRARIVLGGVGRVPRRAAQAEAHLVTRPITPKALARAAELAVEGATPVDANRWKVGLAQSATLAALEEALS